MVNHCVTFIACSMLAPSGESMPPDAMQSGPSPRWRALAIAFS
ncbi:hypothetical protein PLANPX_3601 [Lacipirellula parvula]|uniref:Uncharacterized protein n=1 Tax=Lacipirellula parvula TaxID=2650471 RepID=A0A5K7XLZ1_9BACT|nr:hypothetical protein PLANPX_3601 [Lacipirellula parvula]